MFEYDTFDGCEDYALFRVSFAEEEGFPWLSLLLDAYSIIDFGADFAVRHEETVRNQPLACRDGCAECCRQTDIPVYPIELAGMYWYATEKLVDETRESVMQNLASYKPGSDCPFLVDESCSIYSLRPTACRWFNVFDKRCASGEDPFHTRNKDVLVPLQEYTDRAFFVTLPFYGIIDEDEMIETIEAGYLHSKAMNLHEIDWKKLLKVMKDWNEGNQR